MSSIGDIGSKLVALRRQRGVSQRELGDLLGVRQQQVARWEASAYASASLARVDAAAAALGFGDELGLRTDSALLAAESPSAYGAVTDTRTPTPVRDLGEVIARLRRHRAELADRYSVAALGVFGSFATGEQTIDSDVDLIAEISTATGFGFVQAARRIEELLGRKVDLVRPELLKERLRDRVAREAVDVWRA